MSVYELVTALKDDGAAWETVRARWTRVRDCRLERERLQRMLQAALDRETDAIVDLELSLAVIKNRQEGRPG